MPTFAVSTIFKAIDGVSKPLKKMLRATAAFGKMADKSFGRASKKASMFGSVLKGVLGARVISGGINLLRRGVAGLSEEFINFDQAATSAAAKFPEGIKRGTAAFDKLGKTARDVGSKTKFTAAEAAGGLDFLAMAGFNAKQAMAGLAPAAELAAIGNLDMARSTDIATDTLGAFGLKVNDDIQLAKNMTRVNDTMAKTITTANVDMEQLFETMKFGGASAKNAGVEIETFAALTGIMGNAGIKGSMAGTAMRSMFTRLAAPVGKAKTLLKKLNIITQDSSGDFLKITDILGQFTYATRNMGTAQRTAAIKVVFGQRAISGVSALLDAGKPKMDAYAKSIFKAGGTAKTMAAEMNKSLQNRLLKLKSAAIEVGFKFIDAFQEKIPGAIDMAINAVKKFDVKKVLDQIHRFGLFIENVVELVRDLSPLIWGAVAAFTAYKGIIIAAEAAQWLLNIALGANPIGATILAIGLVVTAIVLLVKNWDEVSEVVQEFWIDFKTIMGKVWDWFKKMLDNPFFRAITGLFGPLLTIPAKIIENWEPIKAFFKGVFDFIKPAVDLAIKGAKKVGGFLGFGDVKDDKETGIKSSLRDKFKQQKSFSESLTPLVPKTERKSPRAAPNEKELASRAQIDFQGSMRFENVPPGAALKGETRGAPPIKMEMSGQN